MDQKEFFPDYLFEVSWEVCNKVGGIYTVVSTKALTIVDKLKNNYILIGPDVYRDSTHHPDFIEDGLLFKTWKDKAIKEGHRIRIGRWNISGKPIAIIVDFTQYFSEKNEIFKLFWEKYKLDSLSGAWDYVEPALFGFAASKVIESFVNFNINYNEKVIAHFHEWMTGTGLLYLKDRMPRIGTVFTTHATVIGRSIAGNGLPLYSKLKEYNGDLKAKDFNVVAKQSLEKNAAQNADCFTTVSEITSRECEQFLEKTVDVITPNGFDDSFVPKNEEYSEKRSFARKKYIQVASALTGETFNDNVLILGISGRYEFKNKGIDVFIDALSKINNSKEFEKRVLAFILIPAGNSGPRKDLEKIISSDQSGEALTEPYLTHYLSNPEYDPVVSKIKALNLINKPGDKVNIFFVPSYLNGDDGIFNVKYYDLLIGQDLTVYASYYEPYGYTPLESLAFSIPTITTSLAGFGLWVKVKYKSEQSGIKVIERNDENDSQIVEEIYNRIFEISKLSKEEYLEASKNAFEISRIALWENLIKFYQKGFKITIDKVLGRTKDFKEVEKVEEVLPVDKHVLIAEPKWTRFIVNKNIPDKLKALEILADNLWWSWNPKAIELFRSIDPELWEKMEENPIIFLEKVPYTKYLMLENYDRFIDKLKEVYNEFLEYMEKKNEKTGPIIAYFSMEFGLHSSLKTYSGGLGILAGDYLKEASDLNKNIVGVGLLYRYGYFKQLLSSKGEQVTNYEAQQFSQTPVKPVRDNGGNWLTITMVLPGRTLSARIWKVNVGRAELYLLDTDYEDNIDQDRVITHYLYGGDEENRFKQELLLGIGGIRALNTLGIKPDLFHINEGHAAFIGIERLRKYVNDENLTFNEALEIVRASSLFTTHTPVPAGHDSFTEDLLRAYIAHYPNRMTISWDQFMNLGSVNPGDLTEKFSMSFLAANLSQEINGVSKLHGKVSQNIFKNLWPGYFPEELHIKYVTNGVHLPTWISAEWRDMLNDELGQDIVFDQSNREIWNKINDIPDEKIWEIKTRQKKNLYEFIIQRLNESSIKRHESPRQIITIKEELRDDALTIGFARRFATYKRAALIFRDLNRLMRIVNNRRMPVQFIFAGKAHPRDKEGQDLLKYIVELSKRPEFLGKIIFLANYDITLAKLLVSGVDVWLNTPIRPLEASGTSGEKAVMNGGLHFSVLDGWWLEGYKPEAGWALSDKKVYFNQNFQDELDAEIIYNLLEEEIAPLYYERDSNKVPSKWIKYIKNSMIQIAPEFTMKRMWDDYENRFYKPMIKRANELKDKDFDLARHIASWKKKIINAWENIEIKSIVKPEISKENIYVGKKYYGEVVVDLKELLPEDIGIELIITKPSEDEEPQIIIYKKEFNLVGYNDNIAEYKIEIIPNDPGVFDLGIRLFPKNELLPHRQDFAYVKWI